MTNSQHQTRAQIERAHDELERLRSQTRTLHGEARLQADQHINVINDRIAELESRENSDSEVLGDAMEGIASAFKSAWHTVSGRDVANNAEKRS